MLPVSNDPTPREEKITNTDEQEVVVNHSTAEEGGYDEPVNQLPSPAQEEKEKKEKEEKNKEKVDTESSKDSKVGKPDVKVSF